MAKTNLCERFHEKCGGHHFFLLPCLAPHLIGKDMPAMVVAILLTFCVDFFPLLVEYRIVIHSSPLPGTKSALEPEVCLFQNPGHKNLALCT